MTSDADTTWANQQLEELGRELVATAERKGFPLRLLGGVAVRIRCEDALSAHPELGRKCGDIDFACLSEHTDAIEAIMADAGFEPQSEMNFLYVGERMMFVNGSLKVDVILDEFRMNHRWSLRQRIALDSLTLSREDLLLTKLQIVSLSHKDMQDLLVMGVALSGVDLDFEYMTRVAARTWGFAHTVRANCEVVLRGCGSRGNLSHEIYRVMLNQIKCAPQSLLVRLRGLIGERLRWYELAEEPSLAKG